MKKVHVTVVLSVIMMLVSMLIVMAPISSTPEIVSSVNSIPIENVRIAGAGGEDPLITNVVANPSFEETRSNGAPTDWGYYGTSYRIFNITYQDLVHGGTYSGRIRTKGIQWGTDAQLYRYMLSNPEIPYMDDAIDLDMYWYGVSVPDLDDGAYYNLELQCYNGSHWYYLRYVLLHGTYNPTSGGNTHYYFVNGTTSTWNNLNREVESDFSNAFGLSSGFYVYYFRNYIYSPESATGEMEIVVDDIRLDNSTYQFLPNGDFEGSGNWNYNNEAPVSIMTSTQESTDGLRSLNMTSSNTDFSTNSYAYVEHWIGYPAGVFTNAPGEVIIEFDWMYNDVVNGGDSQAAAFWLIFENDTQWYQAMWTLGRGNDVVPSSSNNTDEVYFLAPGFGSRGVWNHFLIDLYDIYDYFNLTGGTFDYADFECWTSNYENSSVTLLVDDYQLRTYPTFDPGFEQDWYWRSYNPIGSWFLTGNQYPYTSRVTDAHSGTYAARCSVQNGLGTGVYRNPYTILTPGTYTDFWWRLDNVSGPSNAFASFNLIFDESYYLTYLLGSTDTVFSNSSNYVYYYVDGFNQIGTWTNLVRNIWADLTNYFGNYQWNLTQIECFATSSGTSNVTVLFDDVHFVKDTHPPVISTPSRETPNPMYYNSVIVSVDVTDLELELVQLHFNNGSWYTVDMINTGSDFVGWITPAAYGTEVQFYVTATDYSGLMSTEDNGGAYYTYTCSDDIDPTVTIEDPDHLDTAEGILSFVVTADDPDSDSSGVSHIELWEGGFMLLSDDAAPWGFDIDTRTIVNGSHSFEVKAYDNAGNTASDYVLVNVDNDQVGPVISDVNVNPLHPNYDQSTTITVAVVDHTAVANVTLFYQLNEGDWSTLTMDRDGVLFTATLPEYPWNTAVSFYVVAYDTYGLSTSRGSAIETMGYDVIDNIAPVLSVTGPPTTMTLSGTVQFLLSTSDTGSGLAEYTIRADGSLVEEESLSGTSLTNDVFLLDTLTLENGNYTILFTVFDNAGNAVEFEVEYAVYNPVGLEGIGTQLSELMAQYGFFIGAGAVVILIIVIQVLLRKRRAS